MTGETQKVPMLTRLVELFLRGDVAIMLIVLSMLLGVFSLIMTPREEEPQIVVPMADVLVSAPGLSAHEVEQQVTVRLEKLLNQIDGVEYLYSMSRPGQCVVTVRFYVGEDREDSLVKLYNKVHSNVDLIPPSVTAWVVKPVEVDDVPILNLTLWSDRDEYGDHELRRIAEQLQHEFQAIHNTNRVDVIGGRPRIVRIVLHPAKLAGRGTSALQVAQALQASNVNLRAGAFEQQNEEFVVEAGTFLQSADELKKLVVNVADERPVYLEEVAQVIDGPAEVDSYTWIGYGPAAVNPLDSKDGSAADTADAGEVVSGTLYPAVHVAVGKRKGSNAVWVASAVERRMRELADPRAADRLLPEGVHYRITRDYGETADAKVTDLIKSLGIAVLTVIGLIGLVMGWRTALVIALAIPVCYSVTLFINLLTGYTINRVTLFALILALGLLVDDPITGVENIERYLKMGKWSAKEAVLRAIQEVQPALLLSTLAIIASFLPLMFITGMMGPYMGPMALNVPLTVTVSTVVAIIITPWIAMVALRKLGEKADKEYDVTKQPLYRASSAVLGRIIDSRLLTWMTLGAVVVLLFAAMALPAFRVVPLKMLPYDNKNEFQIIVDMPEGTTLEKTEAVSRQLGDYLATVAEVRDYQLYVGTASAMDFNGMVRHYFLRHSSNLADIRVNLAPKERRSEQSHTMLLRVRDDLTKIAEDNGGRVKLVEIPPGPPVIATITAEVYGPVDADYEHQIAAAKRVEARMAREPMIVDVDISSEDDQQKCVFETDQPKAALSGISKDDVAKTLQIALKGMPATVLHPPGEVDPLWAELRVARAERSAIEDLEDLYVQGREGQMVQLGALGRFVQSNPDGSPVLEDKTIYHKDLQRVVYVFGEVAGRPPADAILDMQFDQEEDGTNPTPAEPRPWKSRTWLKPGGGDPWAIPAGDEIHWAGEGEWKITLDVFRDLGLAFAAAQVGIFIILMFQTGSRLLPLVIMMAIPLTMIGIMPGFWLLNVLVDRPIGPSAYPNPVFFTATAMIGMIALGGIVVRNSVVLIDFINQGTSEGLSMREAVIQSVAVRTRPILLTAGTTLLGNWVITLDPIFSGLAWAIIFGILTSTVFTLLVIPLMYWMLYGKAERAVPR